MQSFHMKGSALRLVLKQRDENSEMAYYSLNCTPLGPITNILGDRVPVLNKDWTLVS